MTSLPVAHIAGMPLEETLASLTPALVLTFGAAFATLRARLQQLRSRAKPEAPGPTSSRAARAGRHPR